MSGISAAAPLAVPEGFAPSRRSSNLLDLLGPLFEREAGGDYRIGLRIDERHSNGRGFCHGAVLALLADVHLGRLCSRDMPPPLRLVTAGLSLSYLAPAKLGDWLEAVGAVDRSGKRLACASGLILANGEPAQRAVGTFQIVDSARGSAAR